MEGPIPLLALVGGALLIVAAMAWYAEFRRARRRHLDRVGFMPWTGLFFLSLLGAFLAFGALARTWLGG